MTGHLLDCVAKAARERGKGGTRCFKLTITRELDWVGDGETGVFAGFRSGGTRFAPNPVYAKLVLSA